MKRFNISYRLGVYIIIIEVILAVTILYTGYNFTKGIIYNNLIAKTKFRTQVAAESFISTADQVSESVDYVGINAINTDDEDEIFSYVSSVLKVKSRIDAIHVTRFNKSTGNDIFNSFVIHKEGKIEVVNKSYPDVVRMLRSWYNDIPVDKPNNWSEPFFINDDTYPYIAYAKVFPLNGESTVVSCIYSLKDEINDLDKSKAIHKSGTAILFTPNGNILYHTDHKYIGKSYKSLKDCFTPDYYDRLPEVIQHGDIGVRKINSQCFEHNGSLIVSWPTYEDTWVMMLVLSKSEVLGRLNKVMFILIILSIIGVAIIIFITLILIRHAVSPITKLANDTKKIMAAEGAALPESKDEIKVLSGGMDRLKERVETFQKKWIETYKDKEAIDKELLLARDIEMSLVPKFPLYPDRNEFSCYADLIPARTVGGDLFDIFLLDENRLLITICDTVGKGIPAAMFSVMTRTLIRNIASRNYRASEIVKQLNDELSGGEDSGMFVTVFIGILNLPTGDLSYCNAGHTHPLIVNRRGNVKELTKSHGIPVGAMRDQDFGESLVNLKKGNLIVGYTDGITEENDDKGELYGVERLISELESNYKESTQKLTEKIIKSVEKFRDGTEQRDDISVITLRYNGDKRK